MNKIELCEYGKCTQCNACQIICPKNCISFVDAKDGFCAPRINRDECIECGACMRACHRINSKIVFQNPIKTYACWTKKSDDREKSSSGGAFSVIARKIIEGGGVVYGACMCDDLKVRHIEINCQDDVALLQGSKYVQSYLGDTFKSIQKQLSSSKDVLFVGTPCQVAGLYSFLNKTYNNLFTCDLVCHGVPSQKAFDIYIEKVGLKGHCKNFNFRFTKGWGFQLSSQQVSPKEKIIKKRVVSPKNAYYLRAFTKGLMFNEACYSCAYANPERISDFTMADFWGLGEKIPFDHPTNKGVSCLLVNNERALALFNNCSDFEYEERPLEEAIEGNYNLSHVSIKPKGHDSFYEDSKELPIQELSVKYNIKPRVTDYLRLIKQHIIGFMK